ncbi:hypothetical protein ILUMI_04638 [Ignelater luminosus]|uniref:Uncharacterized protein n=1 Tax=Ignelater luminosus TaxID=2038154 RepID=A0A8K0DE33_IGNLU|nr:hypothetical protein ILUMI_04638 [Ignelater luminosus]
MGYLKASKIFGLSESTAERHITKPQPWTYQFMILRPLALYKLTEAGEALRRHNSPPSELSTPEYPRYQFAYLLEIPTTSNRQVAAALIPSTPYKQQLKE